jgi:hypothetical protein
MIVASLLLILVAVTLLVLGLAGGSSSLLISSIVASLLAAVALVIGARQASAARRAVQVAGDDLVVDPVGESSVPDRRAAPPADEPLPASDDLYDGETDYASGHHDADAGLAAPDVTQRVHPDADLYDDAATGRASSAQAAGAAARAEDPDPDYDRAASAIGGARAGAPEEPAWRREPAPGDTAPAGEGPAFADAQPDHDPFFAAGPSGAGLSDAGPSGAGLSGAGLSGAGLSGAGPSGAGLSGAGPSGAGPSGAGPENLGPDYVEQADEFDDPDPDDPDDEPLPQAVRPADAVKVARLDAEVLVVDGRPRYHLPDCPHLIGRMTEGLPVAEAVELGFSPCGLCRPVDRLVAATARY